MQFFLHAPCPEDVGAAYKRPIGHIGELRHEGRRNGHRISQQGTHE